METIAGHVCLLFTPAQCRHDPWRTLEDAIGGGVDIVQWRVKHRDIRAARRCQEICTNHHVPLIVNDDCILAVEIGAAGVHVGQDDTPLDRARTIVGRSRWVGVSTHDVAQVVLAATGGADYLGFGPIFPTTTKGYTRGLPRGALRAAATATSLPVFAIGGIDADNVGRIVDEGVDRVAVSKAVLGANDPGAAVVALRAELGIPPTTAAAGEQTE